MNPNNLKHKIKFSFFNDIMLPYIHRIIIMFDSWILDENNNNNKKKKTTVC